MDHGWRGSSECDCQCNLAPPASEKIFPSQLASVQRPGLRAGGWRLEASGWRPVASGHQPATQLDRDTLTLTLTLTRRRRNTGRWPLETRSQPRDKRVFNQWLSFGGPILWLQLEQRDCGQHLAASVESSSFVHHQQLLKTVRRRACKLAGLLALFGPFGSRFEQASANNWQPTSPRLW